MGFPPQTQARTEQSTGIAGGAANTAAANFVAHLEGETWTGRHIRTLD